MNEHAENEALLAAADAISNGAEVDWDTLQRTSDPADAAVIAQLRILHEVARTHSDPGVWGSLTILTAIGKGAFGVVYRAYDPDLQREVALKVINGQGHAGDFDPERAVREARLLARVHHPNVVTVYGAQRAEAEVGIWMELINGHTLDALVQRQGRFSAREAAVVGVDLCRALAAVHGAGLVHGNLKAHNVMREQGGRIVLMDFGAGRDLTHEPYVRDSAAGTPLYLAPEVFAGAERTRASDIYSLGVLLYYLVTGAYPVEGDTRTQVERHHRSRTPRRHLRDVRPDLPDAFIRVIDRATAEEPAQRYATVGAFEAALTEAPESRAVERRVSPARVRVAYVAVLVAIVAAMGMAAYWRLGTPVANAPATEAPAAAPAAASNAAAGVGAYQVDAGVYRDNNGRGLRLDPDARLAPGDKLYLQIETSVPAHVYVVNEDDRGESYLLFPLPGQQPSNPLPAGVTHRLPGVQSGQEMYWQVTSAGGREHFLMFVSPEKLPALEQMFAALPQPKANQPVLSARLSNEAVGVLRGIGGLAAAPSVAGQAPRLTGQFPTPLSSGAETARGLWVRQITFENPN